MSEPKKHSDDSNQVFIYKPKKASDKKRFGDSVVQGVTNYTFPKPAPTIAISSDIIMDRSDSGSYSQGTDGDEVARKDTITFTGYFLPPMSVDSNGCRFPSIAPGPLTTQWIFGQQRALRAAVLQKFLTIEVNDKDGVNLDTFTNCNVVSIEFPAGNNAQFGEYTLTFESFNTTNMDNNHIEYDYEFTVNEDESMGYFNTSENAVITNSHLVGSESITVNALSVSDAKDFLEAKRKFTGSTVIHLSSSNSLNLDGSGNNTYKPANITYNTSTSPTDGTVTYTASFILMPESGYSENVLGTLTYGMAYDSVELIYSGNVAGQATGVSVGFNLSSTENSYKAMAVFDNVSANSRTKLQSLYSSLSGLIESTKSESVTRSFGTGSVDFTIEFTDEEARNFQVANVMDEQITVSYNPQRTAFASVPVIGREAGPILQDAGGKTERTKQFSIEVQYLPGFGNESGPGTQAIEDANKPTGTRVIFETEASTSWNSSERRFTRSKSWVYEY